MIPFAVVAHWAEPAGFAGVSAARVYRWPLGPDDDEVESRDAEMDSGAVSPISHAEFPDRVGRSSS